MLFHRARGWNVLAVSGAAIVNEVEARAENKFRGMIHTRVTQTWAFKKRPGEAVSTGLEWKLC